MQADVRAVLARFAKKPATPVKAVKAKPAKAGPAKAKSARAMAGAVNRKISQPSKRATASSRARA